MRLYVGADQGGCIGGGKYYSKLSNIKMNNDYFDNVNQNDLDDLIKDMKQFHTNTKNTVNPDNQKLFNKLANEINDYLKEIDRVDVNGEIKFFNTEVSGSYKTM